MGSAATLSRIASLSTAAKSFFWLRSDITAQAVAPEPRETPAPLPLLKRRYPPVARKVTELPVVDSVGVPLEVSLHTNAPSCRALATVPAANEADPFA